MTVFQLEFWFNSFRDSVCFLEKTCAGISGRLSLEFSIQAKGDILLNHNVPQNSRHFRIPDPGVSTPFCFKSH